MKISDVDKNFKIESKVPFDDVKFINCEEEPFKIYGVFKENGTFRRMPENIAKTVTAYVNFLCTHTAGGRLRFKTNSKYIAINATMPHAEKMPHFALTGSTGFDMYVKVDGVDTYYRTFIPPIDIQDAYEGYFTFPDNSMREITINFPLYSAVSDLYIGLQNTAELLPPTNYKIEKPIVYYGSSITQGGCASRPGNSYEAMVSRSLDANHINLGFSGNAKGEPAMMKYISRLDMAAFVYDYDFNAPNAQHLQDTHENGFKIIREANPDLPIIIMPRPSVDKFEDQGERYKIIKATYDNAIKNGDKNVYFISGQELMQIAGCDGTVDFTHPNDLGFYSMAKALEKVLKNIL